MNGFGILRRTALHLQQLKECVVTEGQYPNRGQGVEAAGNCRVKPQLIMKRKTKPIQEKYLT